MIRIAKLLIKKGPVDEMLKKRCEIDDLDSVIEEYGNNIKLKKLILIKT